MLQKWKTVRIFISSTFRDMHAERNHLVRFVFPELKEKCRKHRVHLIIDCLGLPQGPPKYLKRESMNFFQKDAGSQGRSKKPHLFLDCPRTGDVVG
jgi:hypothetical protein